ncbi:phage baseplate assembly protein V [Solimicrobium silvestre]|uniref:Phage baseplate assembly protein V n=1 Tax=Solimicrobium silvestre TaxID=2099400 RepID=A0A2S9GTD4_9BURK|nr:phage baseplate assembly protein V [Solimicrobium silvestre]PRC90973.1 Phage baseplate assembly protein V [Solimicrobium silvestre]
MTSDLSDLLRLILNLIRFGSIAEVDYDAQKVRVLVGKNLTDWRPWATQRAGDTQTWWPPTKGEQVILFSPEGDFNQSILFPAVYSEHAKPPSTNPAHHTTKYPDGAIIQYDHEAHALTAILPSGSSALVKADKVTSDAKETLCTGNLTVAKNLIVNGMSSLNAGMAVLPGTDGAAASIQGKLNVSDDVIAKGISLTGHKHPVIALGADSGVAK